MSTELQTTLSIIGVYIVITIVPSTIMAIRIWKSGDKRKGILILLAGIIPFVGLMCWALIIASLFKNRKNAKFVRVFVPRSHRMIFPQMCVHCLKPSVVSRQLEEMASNTRQTGLRTTTTTTTTSKIGGIPYCQECASLSDKLKKNIRRLNWGSVLVYFIVIFVVAGMVGGNIEDNSSLMFYVPFVAVFVLQFITRLILRIKHPSVKKLQGGMNHHLGISMKFADEKAPSQGVYLTFDNITYGQRFAEANNLPIGDKK